MHDRDPCPVCGHRRKPTLMSANPDAPGFVELLKGKGEPLMQRIAWSAALFAAVLVLVGVLAVVQVRL